MQDYVNQKYYLTAREAPKSDWITVVPANAPHDTYDEWSYTEGHRQGTMTFDALSPGTYEVRLYFNWKGDGGYQVQDRYQFRVQE